MVNEVLVKMKLIVDPLGLFVICISKDSYQISVIGGVIESLKV